MVAMYPLCAFRNNPVAASIDTPLHGFLPFPHVDHLHPDWGIALAASANGKAKMDEFNREFGHQLVWLPWQRPGFELALMMKRAVAAEPGLRRHCAGRARAVHLGRDAARVLREHDHRHRSAGAVHRTARTAQGQGALWRRGSSRRGADRQELAIEIAPFLRGRISAQQRWIASFSDAADVLAVREFRAREGIWRSWAPVAPITLSAPRSGPCLCRGRRMRTSMR